MLILLLKIEVLSLLSLLLSLLLLLLGFPIDNYIQAVRSIKLYNARDPLIVQKWDTNRDHMLSVNDNNDDNDNEYCIDNCNNNNHNNNNNNNDNDDDIKDNNDTNDNTFITMNSYYSKCFTLYD